MRRHITGVAALVGAVVLAAGASAGGGVSGQRVAIRSVGAAEFTLTPLAKGAIERDSGTVGFCCWIDRSVIRDGQRIDVTNGPSMTLTSRLGTLEVKNQMEWSGVPGGYSVFTGTWHVVRGTGAYAGASGHGRVAGIELPGGATRWERQGVLHVK